MDCLYWDCPPNNCADSPVCAYVRCLQAWFWSFSNWSKCASVKMAHTCSTRRADPHIKDVHNHAHLCAFMCLKLRVCFRHLWCTQQQTTNTQTHASTHKQTHSGTSTNAYTHAHTHTHTHTNTLRHTHKHAGIHTHLHGLNGSELFIHLLRETSDGRAHKCSVVTHLFLNSGLHFLGSLWGL